MLTEDDIKMCSASGTNAAITLALLSLPLTLALAGHLLAKGLIYALSYQYAVWLDSGVSSIAGHYRDRRPAQPTQVLSSQRQPC